MAVCLSKKWLNAVVQDLAPTNISINGNPCSIQLNITLSNVVSKDKTATGISPLSAEVSTDVASVEQAQAGGLTTVSASY